MRDAGRQPERTELAWYRTGGAMVFVGFLSLHMGTSNQNVLELAAALIAAASASAMFIHGKSKSASGELVDVADGRRAALIASGATVVIAGLHMIALLTALISRA